MRVKGLTITTAENNFIHARRRVQEKLGKNKTGNAPPPPTPAFRRGGSRPGPGRVAGTASHTTPFPPCPGPRQEKTDTIDHPRLRERASGQKREPSPHPHGAPPCEHPGIDPSIGGRTALCACGAAFTQSGRAVSYYKKMRYPPRFRCFVCSAAQKLLKKQALHRPASTPSPTPAAAPMPATSPPEELGAPPAAAAADPALQPAAGQFVVDLSSTISTLRAKVCAVHDELDALTTRLEQLQAVQGAPTTTTKKKKKKKKKTARNGPSPDPATPPPTPADPIALSTPPPPFANLITDFPSVLHSLAARPELNGPVGTVTGSVSNQGRGLPTSPIADPSPGLTSPGLTTARANPSPDPATPSPTPADPSSGPTLPPSPIADPALFDPTSDAHIASGVDQIERIRSLLCTFRAETASAILEETFFEDETEESGLFFRTAYELKDHLMNNEAPPALCSALGIAQPAWSDDGFDSEQGAAILMALGITAPEPILMAIFLQCHGSDPYDPETAPQELHELHEALAALKPHAT